MIHTLMLVAAMTASHASEAPTTQPAQPHSEPLLAGPMVEPEASRPTLVRRTFDGRLEDVGAEIDAAAIAQLTLTDDQRSAVEQVTLDRHSLFDRLVGQHYALLTELGATMAQQDRRQAIELLGKIRAAFEEFVNRGSFFDEVAPHLTDQQRQQAREMVQEYVAARTMQIQKDLGADIDPPRIAMRIRLDSFGQMVRESIERQVMLGREQFDRLVEALELTSEQANRAQAIFGPVFVKQVQRIATPTDTATAIREFASILTPAQRSRLLGLMIESLKPAAPAPPKPQDHNAAAEKPKG